MEVLSEVFECLSGMSWEKQDFSSLIPWVVCKANIFVQSGQVMRGIRDHTYILFMLI